jgi:hypothetical protein
LSGSRIHEPTADAFGIALALWSVRVDARCETAIAFQVVPRFPTCVKRWKFFLIVFAGVVAAAAISAAIARKRRREYLTTKYGDATIVQAIIDKKIWQGMTKEQLVDSWGSPVDTAQKVLKTKTTETFKYKQVGRNRFRSRVMLENGLVIG